MADVHIDATTFQKPLGQLAEVLAQKVKREAPKVLAAPGFVAFDLHVLIRQAMYTYDLLFYVNADERRQTDCYWRAAYTVVVLPLIRNMVDCLYNITAILQDPARNGPRFRKSGVKKFLMGLDDDQARYGGKPEWDQWIAKARDWVDFDARNNGFTVTEAMAEKEWPTLGRYIRSPQPGGTFTAHQEFLKTLVYGPWREYSAMAHGASEGLLRTAIFYITDSLPHEERSGLEDGHLRLLSAHFAQAAAVLLCIVTELQAYFHFDGANIDERIHKMWNVLMPAGCPILTERSLRVRVGVFQLRCGARTPTLGCGHKLSYYEGMAMTSLNISLPEALKEYVEGQVASGDWGTPSEYVRELIRQDKDRRLGNLEQELVAAAKGGKVELPVAEIRRKGLVAALRERARRR